MFGASITNILHHILNGSGILLLVNFEPETPAFLHDSFSKEVCLFTNTSSKHECVNSAFELNVIASNETADPIYEDIESEFTLRFCRRGDVAEICRAGQSLPAGFLVQDILCLGNVHLLTTARRWFSCVMGEMKDKTSNVSLGR